MENQFFDSFVNQLLVNNFGSQQAFDVQSNSSSLPTVPTISMPSSTFPLENFAPSGLTASPFLTSQPNSTSFQDISLTSFPQVSPNQALIGRILQPVIRIEKSCEMGWIFSMTLGNDTQIYKGILFNQDSHVNLFAPSQPLLSMVLPSQPIPQQFSEVDTLLNQTLFVNPVTPNCSTIPVKSPQMNLDEEESKKRKRSESPVDSNEDGKSKRKYVKSGLYKKDRNGNFLLSSSDRAKLTVPCAEEVQEASTEICNFETNNVVVAAMNDAYIIFCREQSKNFNLSEEVPTLLDQWNQLSEVEKQKYAKLAEKESKIKKKASMLQLNAKPNGIRTKRPLNAYNIFCKAHFEQMKKENPGMTIKELSKLMGDKWKKLSESERKAFQEKVDTTPRQKKPLNSYNIFCKHNFESLKKEYPNQSINTLSKIIAERWKKLPREEKQQYVEEAERRKNILSKIKDEEEEEEESSSQNQEEQLNSFEEQQQDDMFASFDQFMEDEETQQHFGVNI